MITHKTHDDALKSFAAAIATASKKQKEYKKRERVDDYVEFTMNRLNANAPKRTTRKRFEVVRNRDNKTEYLPEYEVYRVDRKKFDLVDRFESRELAEEFMATL